MRNGTGSGNRPGTPGDGRTREADRPTPAVRARYGGAAGTHPSRVDACTRWGHSSTMAQGSVQVTHTGTSRWRRRTGEYDSLSSALDAAADGDVLSLSPGTYRENLVVSRAVTLR